MRSRTGHASPQNAPAPASIGWGLRGSAPQAEDCLVLNVFPAPSANSRRRPVMMWIHGGGYAYGSGSSLGYDGASLARSGRCRRCLHQPSPEHRRPPVSWRRRALRLARIQATSACSTSWPRCSGCVTTSRSSAAIPGNVTIFGQSGGGGKVSTPLAMPAAKGLFHKAIVESGSTLKQMTHDEASKTTDYVTGSSSGSRRPRSRNSRSLPVSKPARGHGRRRRADARFGPVVDGHSLPRDPFDPDAPEVSADVPMIIGTTETRGIVLRPTGTAGAGRDGGARIGSRNGSAPTATASTTCSENRGRRRRRAPSTSRSRRFRPARDRAGRAQGGAAARLGVPLPDSLADAGRRRTTAVAALHRDPVCDAEPLADARKWWAPGPNCRPLADRASGAWVAFARTGNPNHPGIPEMAGIRSERTERPCTSTTSGVWSPIPTVTNGWRSDRSQDCPCSERT